MADAPRILVTNDDGVHAPGLAALAAALEELGRVEVVAPARKVAGAGLYGVLGGTLRVEEARTTDDRPARAVDGYPADCVRFALATTDDPPELVVAGINDGLNLGADIQYSGTVGAAREAAFWGVRALAVSAGGYDAEDLAWSSPDADDYTAAADWAAIVARRLLRKSQQPGFLHNLNVPPGRAGGLKNTRLARLRYGVRYRETDTATFAVELSDESSPDAANADTDLGAILKGYASLTLLRAGIDGPRRRRFRTIWTRDE